MSNEEYFNQEKKRIEEAMAKQKEMEAASTKLFAEKSEKKRQAKLLIGGAVPKLEVFLKKVGYTVENMQTTNTGFSKTPSKEVMLSIGGPGVKTRALEIEIDERGSIRYSARLVSGKPIVRKFDLGESKVSEFLPLLQQLLVDIAV